MSPPPTGSLGGPGMIDADPLFVDAATTNGDLHLRIGSPCVDAGDNGAPGLEGTSFEGDDRADRRSISSLS